MYASAGRLPGANVSVASPEVTLPPVAATIRTDPAGAGGSGPLPGTAAGSEGCVSTLVSVVAPSLAGGAIHGGVEETTAGPSVDVATPDGTVAADPRSLAGVEPAVEPLAPVPVDTVSVVVAGALVATLALPPVIVARYHR